MSSSDFSFSLPSHDDLSGMAGAGFDFTRSPDFLASAVAAESSASAAAAAAAAAANAAVGDGLGATAAAAATTTTASMSDPSSSSFAFVDAPATTSRPLGGGDELPRLDDVFGHGGIGGGGAGGDMLHNAIHTAARAGYGNGTSDASEFAQKMAARNILNKLQRWQNNRVIEFDDEHDFVGERDKYSKLPLKELQELDKYYTGRRNTRTYADLMSDTFREACLNIETYMTKKLNMPSMDGFSNKIEEEFDHYRENFEETAEQFSEFNLNPMVCSMLRIFKTVAGVISANATLREKQRMPYSLQTAFAQNPQLDQMFKQTYLQSLGGGTSGAGNSGNSGFGGVHMPPPPQQLPVHLPPRTTAGATTQGVLRGLEQQPFVPDVSESLAMLDQARGPVEYDDSKFDLDQVFASTSKRQLTEGGGEEPNSFGHGGLAKRTRIS